MDSVYVKFTTYCSGFTQKNNLLDSNVCLINDTINLLNTSYLKFDQAVK